MITVYEIKRHTQMSNNGRHSTSELIQVCFTQAEANLIVEHLEHQNGYAFISYSYEKYEYDPTIPTQPRQKPKPIAVGDMFMGGKDLWYVKEANPLPRNQIEKYQKKLIHRAVVLELKDEPIEILIEYRPYVGWTVGWTAGMNTHVGTNFFVDVLPETEMRMCLEIIDTLKKEGENEREQV